MNPYLLISNPARPSSYLYKMFRLSGGPWPETSPTSLVESQFTVKLAEEFPIGSITKDSAVGFFDLLYGDEVLVKFRMRKWLAVSQDYAVFRYRHTQYLGYTSPKGDQEGEKKYFSGKVQPHARDRDTIELYEPGRVKNPLTIPGDITLGWEVGEKVRSAYQTWEPAPPAFANDVRQAVVTAIDSSVEDDKAGEPQWFRFSCQESHRPVVIQYAFWVEEGGFIKKPWTPLFVVSHSDPYHTPHMEFFMEPDEAMKSAFGLCSEKPKFTRAHPDWPLIRSERQAKFIAMFPEAYEDRLAKFKEQLQRHKEITQELYYEAMESKEGNSA